MSAPHDDRELRTAFTALREEDRRRAPSYETVRGTPARRHAVAWAVVAAAAVGAVALAGFLLRGGTGEAEDLSAEIAMARSLSSWSAPTDALYDLTSVDIPDSVSGLDLGSQYVPDALGSGTWQDAAADSPARTDAEDER